VRAILVGAVESTRVALEAFRRSGDCDLSLVLSLLPEKASRHSDFVDLSPDTTNAGIPLVTVNNINEPASIELIGQAEADYMFVIGWSQICGPEVMGSMPDRIIGYHPAPLPRMRGRAAIPWTILQEEPITAGTLFWIEDGVDSGPILDQEFFHVANDETAASLYDRHMEALAAMIARTLERMARGQVRRDPQDDRYASWAAKRTAEDGKIDWNRPAAEIDRLVRAVGRPYPGAFTEFNGERLVIRSSRPVSVGARHAALPGQIVENGNTSGNFVVNCGGDSALEVLEWECQGDSAPRLHAKLGRTS
jgi:methionyl-tRNA formyltransferase